MLAMDSDRLPLRKRKDVPHGAVRDVPLRQSVEQPCLPSYSPDFNPIEQLFAKLKELLRKAAARTKEALWDAIGRHLDDFTPGECRNYLAHCGYEL